MNHTHRVVLMRITMLAGMRGYRARCGTRVAIDVDYAVVEG